MANRLIKRVVWSLVVLVIIAVVGTVVWWVHQTRAGLLGAAGAELRGVVISWNSANQPKGQELLMFMNKCPDYILISNRVFTVGGKTFVTQFATKRLGMPGTLFVTTNNVLILLDSDEVPSVVR